MLRHEPTVSTLIIVYEREVYIHVIFVVQNIIIGDEIRGLLDDLLVPGATLAVLQAGDGAEDDLQPGVGRLGRPVHVEYRRLGAVAR